jgi:hypothetical protein
MGRINRLLPGSYKVATVPTSSPFAAAYWGGGEVQYHIYLPLVLKNHS